MKLFILTAWPGPSGVPGARIEIKFTAEGTAQRARVLRRLTSNSVECIHAPYGWRGWLLIATCWLRYQVRRVLRGKS